MGDDPQYFVLLTWVDGASTRTLIRCTIFIGIFPIGISNRAAPGATGSKCNPVTW